MPFSRRSGTLGWWSAHGEGTDVTAESSGPDEIVKAFEADGTVFLTRLLLCLSANAFTSVLEQPDLPGAAVRFDLHAMRRIAAQQLRSLGNRDYGTPIDQFAAALWDDAVQAGAESSLAACLRCAKDVSGRVILP